MVDVLELEGDGLNLTQEVREGILCHTGSVKAKTLEGQILWFADRIAYINHDIEDAMRGGIIYPTDIPLYLQQELGYTESQRINTLVADVIEHSADQDRIQQSEEIGGYMNDLRDFLFQSVYHNPMAKGEEGKAQEALYSCETMRNVCRHLENVAGPAYGNAWITCGQRRLDAMELLLKSGLCPAEQLRRWAAELRKMETLIPVMEERQLFAEAVTALDLFDMFTGEGGMISGAAGEYRPLPYRTLKFFLPQLWWYLTVDRTRMLQLYNVSDLREVSAERVRGGTYVYSGMSLTSAS